LPQPSTLIEGKYEILGKIREGGMGTIYRVRHRLLDEVRVIKVLKAQSLSDEDMKRRFVDEARTATRLKHPNIGAIHDFALDEEGKAYLVMEYIDGVNLADLLKRQGPLGLPLGLEIAHQSLLALGYLHRKNIVHRDVAPDNLMLTRDEDNRPRVKLIDLGIAKSLDRTGGMTSTGIFLGKIKYASPEQFGALTAGEKLDGRSDIYALGVVLYELLTGVHPFVGESPSELLRAHIFDPPLPFSQTDKERKVPPELRAALQMALEKRREDRFSSAEEFDRQIVALKEQYPRADAMDDTASIISRVRAAPPSLADPLVTPSAQDRLDEQFAAAATPRPSRPTALESLDQEPTEVVPYARAGTPSPTPGAPASGRLRVNRRVAGVLTAILGLAAGAFLLSRLVGRPEPARTSAASRPVPTAAAQKPSNLPAAPAREATAAPEPTAADVVASESPDAQPSTRDAELPAAAPEPRRLRREAEQSRSLAAAARQHAEREKAPEQAAALYDFGRGKEREARDFFAREDFVAARAASEAARDSFDKSEQWARRHPPPRATPAVRIAAAPEGAPRREPPAIPAPLPTAVPAPVRILTAAPAVPERERSTDEEKIRDAVRRYEKAQSTLDADLYARVYPSVDKARVRAAFEQLRSQKLVFEIQKVELAPGAATAVVRGLEKREAVPQVGSEQHTVIPRVITLEKRADAWVITSLAS
jgi:eukaryotic-like serine/threonine-protein kinase